MLALKEPGRLLGRVSCGHLVQVDCDKFGLAVATSLTMTDKGHPILELRIS